MCSITGPGDDVTGSWLGAVGWARSMRSPAHPRWPRLVLLPTALLALAALLGPARARAEEGRRPPWRQLVQQTAAAFAQPGEYGVKRAAVQQLITAGRDDAWMILLAALEQEGRHLEAFVDARRLAWSNALDLWQLPRAQHHFELQRQLRSRFDELAAADLGWFRESMLVSQMEMRLQGMPDVVRAAYVTAATTPGPRLHPDARRAIAALVGPGLRTPEDARAFRVLLERDPDERVRLAALAALPMDGPFAEPLRLRRLRDPSWVVRLAAARALAARGSPTAVPLLERARVHAGPREDHALTEALRALGAPASTPPAGIRFLGESIPSHRLVFVLDTSAASAASWAATREAVSEALDQLPATARFGLIAYNGAVEPWKTQAVPATPEAKAQARDWLAAQRPAWHACLGGALRQAFRMAGLAPEVPGESPIDTLVLVAASAPTLYGHEAPHPQPTEDLLQLARAWNRDRRIRMVCVSVDPAAAPVLAALAADHDGTYLAR